MVKVQRSSIAVNMLGAIGYLMLVVVWVFAFVIIISLLLSPSTVTSLSEAGTTHVQPAVAHPSLILAIASYIITALMIIVAIGVAVTLPYLIGRWLSRFVRVALRILKISVTLRVLFLTKGVFMIIPLLALMITYYFKAPIDMTLAMMFVVTVVAAVIGLIAFLLQGWLAVRRKLITEKTW